MFFGKVVAEPKVDESRPVKMVQEKENVWRVVYADNSP
jgi:hypothetical protein